MRNFGPVISEHDLRLHGLEPEGDVYWNLPPAQLYEHAVRRQEARLAAEGPIVATTGNPALIASSTT